MTLLLILFEILVWGIALQQTKEHCVHHYHRCLYHCRGINLLDAFELLLLVDVFVPELEKVRNMRIRQISKFSVVDLNGAHDHLILNSLLEEQHFFCLNWAFSATCEAKVVARSPFSSFSS